MFKRQNRLPGGIFNSSSIFTTPLFVLKVKDNSLSLNRFGIVVSKKIDKRAVGRNRIKRMLREILVGFSNEMTSGHDMLIIVRTGIINKTARQCSLEIKNILEKSKYINL